ncbi:ATP phosphoribosyltransferase (ATP-PRTase) (ATP-PRT) [Ceratocystis pirilliformis]|uniref:ATP phosphoribosyltransferase n=1 Tax=Ceratocystis pirilliformis TaxID=259994 RepID=A0ABR3YZ88_9PEZI
MDLVNHLEGRLLFAVPKKGRLNQACLNLLEGADIQFRREHRLDIALVKNHPIALVFLPAADIPTFVGEGRVDLGITGWDQVAEHDAAMRANRRAEALLSGTPVPSAETPAEGTSKPVGGCITVIPLGFGSCKLQVQVPVKGTYKATSDLVGKTVCTSFVNLAAAHFSKLENCDPSELKTKIIEIGGSVEAACALGVADGIVDLVESGETMRAAGLTAIDTVVDTEAILIKSLKPSDEKLVDKIAKRISGVITAQRYVLCQYNIESSKLSQAVKITPGKRAPTVTPLNDNDWISVSAMIEKKKIAIAMDDLSDIGAKDILVLDIHNTR